MFINSNKSIVETIRRNVATREARVVFPEFVVQAFGLSPERYFAIGVI